MGGCGVSERVQRVGEWFDCQLVNDNCQLTIGEEVMRGARPGVGEIVLVTGASGSGKSTLLRRVAERMGEGRVVDVQGVELGECAVVDLFGELSLEETLKLLSRVGLAEAGVYVRRPRELSEGQRWRVRLGRALCIAEKRVGSDEATKRRSDEGKGEEGVCLVVDEFGGVLDAVTACVVAAAMRREVRRSGRLCALVATCREEVERAIGADRVIRCDFGRWGVEGNEPRRREGTKGFSVWPGGSAD